jgi:hypothetical protein
MVAHGSRGNSPTAWLLSRIMFDVVPLRIIPTIIVSTMYVSKERKKMLFLMCIFSERIG